MTGFASLRGEIAGLGLGLGSARVNNRGLDLRLRLPDWVEGLELAARAALQGRVVRGSVTLSLRLNRRGTAGLAQLDPGVLGTVVAALAQVETAAEAAGVTLQHSTAAEVLGLKGVMESATEAPDDPDGTGQGAGRRSAGTDRGVPDHARHRGPGARRADRWRSSTGSPRSAPKRRPKRRRGARMWQQALRDNLARVLANAEASTRPGWRRNWRCWR